ADLAAVAAPVAGEQRLEARHAAELHDLEQLRPRVREVLAYAAVDLAPGVRELGLEDRLHERQTAAAARAGLRARLHAAHRGELLLGDRPADGALGDPVARADEVVVGERSAVVACARTGEQQ